MENMLAGLTLGLVVWFVVWGLNRIYLMFKGFLS